MDKNQLKAPKIRKRSRSSYHFGVDDGQRIVKDVFTDCLLCGVRILLSNLVDHQRQMHFKGGKRMSSTVTCNLCNGRMPGTSLARHQQRKHSIDFGNLNSLVIRSASGSIKASSTTFVSSSLPSMPPISQSQSRMPPSFKDSEHTKPMSNQPIVIHTKAELDVEQDDNGFYELVVIEK